MAKIVILGSSGHGKVIIDIVQGEGKHEIAGLVDRYQPIGHQVFGFQVLGSEEDLPRLAKEHFLTGVIIAVGDNFLRSEVATRVAGLCPELRFVPSIHPQATIGRDVSIGEGTVIMAGVIVNPSCSIGRFCILNTASSLDHDSTMGDFSSLGPRAATAGRCHIGTHSAIGIGAVLIEDVTVGEHAIVGAGSTLLKNIAAFSVAYGSPAKEIRRRLPGDRYLRP
jgi:sugar O-acyltransferase (sialic acid O-acetyltransferase NeuD family)